MAQAIVFQGAWQALVFQGAWQALVFNFAGRRVYPSRSGHNILDDGPRTKQWQTGLARGHTNPDYNVKLRGLGQRIDKLRP